VRLVFFSHTTHPATKATSTDAARQSRVVTQSQPSQNRTGTNAHHMSGVPMSRIWLAHRAAPQRAWSSAPSGVP
jgi:hypothetical protein